MRIAILGGGLTGLCAAHHLLGEHEVTVFEKKPFFGGLAASFEHEGFKLPLYYHHVIESNTTTLEYFKNFGLLDEPKWKHVKMGIAVNSKVYDFTDPASLLNFDYLSPLERLRYGLFGAYALYWMNPDAIPDGVNAYDWLVSKAGRGVTEKIFVPLYAENKFGIPLKQISARQFATRLKSAEFKTRFVYPKKGFHSLVNGFEKRIKKKGGELVARADVKLDAGKKVVSNKGKKQGFDAVINTAPLPEFLDFTKGLPKAYAEKLGRIRYCSAVCVGFGTKDFLDKHYWTNILKQRVHMVMQHSRLYDGYPFKFNWVLRYGGSEKDLGLSDAQIKSVYLRVVKKHFPKMEVEWSKVFRERYASPIYDLNYLRNKPGYETPVNGLYQAGVAVTYPWVRDCNSALKSGERVAEIVQ